MRILRLLALLVFLLALLAACSSVRLTYDNADWLLARMAASYVDLDREQSQALKSELARFHDWHRQQELPQYARLFDQAAERLQRGMSREDAQWAVRSVQIRLRVLGRQAAEEMAPLLMTLNESQLDDLERRFARDNRKFYAAQLADDPQQAVRARSDWFCDRLEDWTGSLTAAQRERVTMLARASPDLPALRLETRKQRQAEFLRLLRQRHDPAVQAELVAFLADPDASRSEPYAQAVVAWQQQFIDMLVDLDRSLTPRQRERAVARLRSYAAAFRGLSTEAVVATGS